MADKLRFVDDAEDYEPTDSEDGSDEERELLSEVQQMKVRHKEKQQEKKGAAVLPFADSSDDDMHDSDIEGAPGANDADIPDAADWGSRSHSYYHTDFVDQDYSTYNEQEAEAAQQEEQEAKIIQLRLAKQMKDDDFCFDELLTPAGNDSSARSSAALLTEASNSTRVQADLKGLSKRQLQQLFLKDSPEFDGLVTDMERYLVESRDLLTPVLDYVHAKKRTAPLIPALQFADLYRNMLHTYCSNVSVYLLLKARRVPIRAHPILKRLVQLKKLIGQLRERYDSIVRPQLEALLERIEDGDEFEILSVTTQKKAKQLSILDQYNVAGADGPLEPTTDLSDTQSDDDDDDEMAGESDAEDAALAGDERRGITYQIAKNKGLTPQRKKEQRNPRVKHRSKFRKALIRRKGAVRTVRKETKRYGGEVSGIKAGVTKSIKFKV